MLTCLFCKKMLIHRYGYKPKKFCNDQCRMAHHRNLYELKAIKTASDQCLVCEKPFTEKEKRKGKRTCSNSCRSKLHQRNKSNDTRKSTTIV